MPFSFLAPAFFAGLLALAVPVLVHLTRRPKKQAIEFPSLMFLRQIPHQATRRRRIRNWPLFLLRSLAIILLVAAFARPFLDRRGAAATPLEQAREVVILLDRSASMDYGEHWPRALTAARRTVDGLRPDDRATLVLFDAAAQAANQSTADPARLRAALDAARVGSGATRYEPALKLAQSILDGSALPRREVVLITDFQKAGWNGAEAVRFPAGTRVTPIALGDSATANVSVASVEFRSEPFAGRERVSASARLANKGERAFRDLPVALELDGRAVQTRTVSLEPNSSATVAFAPFTLAEHNTRGVVRAGDDALPSDNAFYFALSPGQAVGVLVLERGGADPEASLYLRRALEIGKNPAFRVETRLADRLRAADLAGQSVVVLNDAPFPRGEAGRRLRAWVEAGGGLITALGPRTIDDDWEGDGASLLAASIGRPVNRSDAGGVTISFADFSHPIFELFNAPRSGDFTPARFFWYRPMTLAGTPNVLARFSDGEVALAERRAGQGRVLVWASTLNSFWNDLPLQPVFLPFVHQLVKHASGYAQTRPWFTAGDVLDLRRRSAVSVGAEGIDTTAPRAFGEGAVARTPSGERVEFGGDDPLLRLEEQGFYELRNSRAADARLDVVAVNLDPAESDLATFDPADLVRAVTAADGGETRPIAASELSTDERERRQALWWYVLLGAFLLLVAESVLGNRLSAARRA